MNGYDLNLAGEALVATASGALWWPDQRLLCVSDLHLGKSERIARLGGGLLPPYENLETLDRLAGLVERFNPKTVICLGDSFDDLHAAGMLEEEASQVLAILMAGRDWVWIEGNHDPGPMSFGGTHLRTLCLGNLIFRHIAEPGATGEISGHYHPKKRVRSVLRPCFLVNQDRIILPAFGTYTGGLACDAPVLADLAGPKAIALLVGPSLAAIPA
ncbi:MAG: ligase-associated DNA damage response endonuclease PdeM [Pseudomonadota bacterium]